MRRMLTLVAIIPLMFVLSACGNEAEVKKLEVFQPETTTSLAINARRLEIIDNWLMPLKAPYVEHELKKPPAASLIEWASLVVQPKGGSGEVILNISEASVKHEELPPAEGFLNSLKDNQETRIRVTLSAQLLWIQPVGNYTGTAELAAKTSQSLPESATPSDYEIATQNLVGRALALIDLQAREEIAKIDGMILP
ncbi:MAG: hypothetical protein ACON4G_04815 [Candidatus Puniceispirillaceae bacterium]